MPSTRSLRRAAVLGALALAPLVAKFDVAPLPGTSAGRTAGTTHEQTITLTAQAFPGRSGRLEAREAS